MPRSCVSCGEPTVNGKLSMYRRGTSMEMLLNIHWSELATTVEQWPEWFTVCDRCMGRVSQLEQTAIATEGKKNEC
jgi:hypothetical protein